MDTVQGMQTSSGLSRREVLRRGAALGAAVAVTGPLVQTLGRMPAFAQTSPPPGQGDAPVVPSHFQMLVLFGADPVRRGIKWDGSWSALYQQGNRCWNPDVENFERPTGEQLNKMSSVPVVSTANGYKVTLPPEIAVVAAATFDGGNCFYLGTGGGPHYEGSALVFSKPASGQGGGGGAGAG